MNIFKEVALIIITIGVLLLFCILIITFCMYKYDVKIGRANIIKVYRSEEMIYQGKQAFVDIRSGGMTTTVTIYKKLFPFEVVDKIYSDSNIRIEN